MNQMMEQAAAKLREMVGQDRVMALATRNGEGVASRTVNVYTFGDSFYFITEADSNKFNQIASYPQVALSVDAIQITGQASAFKHPMHDSNCRFREEVEQILPNQFAKYADNPEMRLLQVEPSSASLISLESGEGYVIDFQTGKAKAIRHE